MRCSRRNNHNAVRLVDGPQVAPDSGHMRRNVACAGRGGQQKSKRDIRVAAIFKVALAAFLHMLDVGELTHLREGEHGKAIYVKSQHLVGCHRNWSSTPTVADSVGVGRP